MTQCVKETLILFFMTGGICISGGGFLVCHVAACISSCFPKVSLEMPFLNHFLEIELKALLMNRHHGLVLVLLLSHYLFNLKYLNEAQKS